MTLRFRSLVALLAVAFTGACGRESPTAVGASLLPASGVRTFEMILDAPTFLAGDTAVSGFVFPINASFQIVANAYADSLSSHALGRFVQPPPTIVVLDSSGTSLTDTLPRYYQGRVVLYVDTSAANGASPVDLRLFRTAQKWDPLTTTWTMAVDSGSTHIAWTQPGGTTGVQVSTATWTPGQDSVIFDVDSATVAAWADTSDLARGALIEATTPGSRFRAFGMGYFVDAHSTLRPDTTVTEVPGLTGSTYVYTPRPAWTPGTYQIGGAPAWRTFLSFSPQLATQTFNCPATSGPPCTFTLHDATVNYAALLLHPLPSGAFVPEDSVRPQSWILGTLPTIPLVRSPLAALVATLSPALAPSLFQPGADSTVAIPVTSFVAALAGDTATAVGSGLPSKTLVLVQTPEPSLLGVARFAGRSAGVAAPRLRLILTLGSEVQLP